MKCSEANVKRLNRPQPVGPKPATAERVRNEKTPSNVAVSRSGRVSKSVDTKTEFDNLWDVFLNMRHLIVLSVMLLFTGGLQGDLSKSSSDGETVVIGVDSTNLRFSPSSVTITEGDTVRFFWSGQSLPHNAVENNGVFDSGEPARNVDYSFTFERGSNGTYEFVCEPHASMGMVGDITVEPAPPLPVAAVETTSEDTPSLSLFATAAVMFLAWSLSGRRQGNG